MTIRPRFKTNENFDSPVLGSVAPDSASLPALGSETTDRTPTGTITALAILASLLTLSIISTLIALFVLRRRARNRKELEAESLRVRGWIAELTWAHEKGVNPVLAPYYVKPVGGEFKDVLEIGRR